MEEDIKKIHQLSCFVGHPVSSCSFFVKSSNKPNSTFRYFDLKVVIKVSSFVGNPVLLFHAFYAMYNICILKLDFYTIEHNLFIIFLNNFNNIIFFDLLT